MESPILTRADVEARVTAARPEILRLGGQRLALFCSVQRPYILAEAQDVLATVQSCVRHSEGSFGLLAAAVRPHDVSSMSEPADIRPDALRLVEQLPADASWDDLAYEVYVRQAITQGLADADAGRTVDHESALARVRARIRRAS
jgi:hypothetical protein